MDSLPLLTRIWFAWLCYFKVLFDGAYAGRLFRDRSHPERALPPGEGEPKKLEAKKPEVVEKIVEKIVEVERKGPPSTDAALQLLALLQREGRLVDFLEEDVASFSDADIGAAARVVHAGCRKAIREHLKLEAVRSEEEGARVTLAEGFDPAEVKLTGNVQGKGPHTGTLRHRGWRAADVKLPVPVQGHDARVVAQAEVEL